VVVRRDAALMTRIARVAHSKAAQRGYAAGRMERVIDQPNTQVMDRIVSARHAERAPDEAAARRTLRTQVAKLERELAEATARTAPHDRIAWSIGTPGAHGPRLLDLGELERIRDDLAERLHEVRKAHAERASREALKRDELERMLRDPASHPNVRISRREVGEPGCGGWESKPRLGLIGMLAGWWHVKISSGCPLSTSEQGSRSSRPSRYSEFNRRVALYQGVRRLNCGLTRLGLRS
jgi:hypothetical protein